MKIIGVTGSIAAGKSTVARWINKMGIATHDSDLAVHELLGPEGEAVPDVLMKFGPHFGTIARGIDRKLLGDEVFASSKKRKTLESILHPMVRQHREIFIAKQNKINAEAVLLDIPLLYETGSDMLCNYVIVVYASAKTTTERALARPNMTKDKLNSILALQMPVDDKKKRADLILDTDLPKGKTRNQLIKWLCGIGLSIDEVCDNLS